MPTTIQQSGGTVAFREDVGAGEIQYLLNGGTWLPASFPVTIVNTSTSPSSSILTVSIVSNITFTSNDNYFICGSEYITFDGMNNICTFENITNYLGLIQNGSNAATGYSYVTVKNIKTASNGSTLYELAGWVCCFLFGKSATNIVITDCSSSGPISINSCGGICGSYIGYLGSITITNCSSSGEISGQNSGGICGSSAGNGGSITITNC